MTTKVLIADDSPTLAGVPSWPGCEVVGVARDGVEAVNKAREVFPDIVVMNIRTSEAGRRIRDCIPGVGIIFYPWSRGYVEAAALLLAVDAQQRSDQRAAKLHSQRGR